jgi:hypothetical protein
MNDQIENCIQEALTQVEAWDLPPEQFCQAVNDQARLMSGIDLEHRDTTLGTSGNATLRF